MANTNTYQAQANELSQKLWAIANELRGQMDASEFKNYILGVIFYRYLSERTEMYMAEILENDGVTYEEAFADDDYRSVVEEWSLTKLGYVIRPENLFRNLIRKITKFESEADRFSVEDFEKAINDLVGSTMGHESNKAFDGLFNDMRLKDPEEWKLWSDSSGKSDPPPDFYNDKLKLMMDVMRIDDHAFESKNGKIVNPTNQRESVIQKQIRKSGLLDSFPNVKNVIVTAVTDLPTDEDHNYKFYYSNFERVLMKHNNQIDLYGKNHPGYKTIFLVLDESSAYFEMESIMDNGVIKGKPHYWFWDNSFVNILKKLNIDYLIWYAPFKYYEVPLGEEKSDLPEVCVIDIKNINQNGSYLNSYDISKMKSVEL